MSITSLVRTLVITLAATFMLLPSAWAQRHHEFTPFIDPLAFNPDYQFFAPADLGDFGHSPAPNTGWYAAYNRMYIYVTRPQLEQSYTEGDFTWGNRIDIGYMTDENKGWLVSGMHIDGPNANNVLQVPLINRFNPDDVPNQQQGGGGGGGGGGGQQQNQAVLPVQDRNNIITGARDFFLTNSLNTADLSGFEINRTWRLDPLHNGGILEPFIGFRYIKFSDFTRRDSYARLNSDPTVPPNPLPNTDDDIERIVNDLSRWDNHMVGGQLGIRWMEHKSRWVLSSELRAFAFENFQGFNNQVNTFTTLYDGGGTGAEPQSEIYSRTNFSSHASEFVFGMDVRAEAAFELTRDVSLIMGVQLLEFGKGIARGNDPSHNSEDLTMFGGTFGVSVNR